MSTNRGRRSNQKGNRGERELANLLKEWWPDARRGLKQCRRGYEEADVTNTPFWWEAKWYKSFAFFRHLRQAEKAVLDNGCNQVPVAAFRIDADTEWVVAFRLSNLQRVAKEVYLGTIEQGKVLPGGWTSTLYQTSA